MPIFQDDFEHDGHVEPAPIDIDQCRSRRLSEESIRTELCEGLVPDSPHRSRTPAKDDSGNDDSSAISDRVELIERLKRGESPTWIPNRHVNQPVPSTEAAPSWLTGRRLQLESIFHDCNPTSLSKRPQTPSDSSSLLPPVQITPEKDISQNPSDQRLQDGLNIERPRSALHSGDFTEDEAATERRGGHIERSHVEHGQSASDNPWISTSPPRDLTPYFFDRRIPFSGSTDSLRSLASSLSSSTSSSFVYKAPTSPLVQSESNEELDFSLPLDGIDFSSRRLGSRRHTTTFSAASSPFLSPSRRVPSYRQEGSFPYQAHQPRRSLTSTPSFLQASASPPTPAFLRSRRSSLVSDSSPIQHAPMVGSYEESILRGRMSTTPSKPLEFLAQIGVLGKGKCKSSLRCPPHVTLSFPAVYYSYSNTPHGRSRSDDGPSPYVGQVDLENGLPNTDDEQRTKRKAQARYSDRFPADDDVEMKTPGHAPEIDSRQVSRTKRRSGSPRAPPGGSYRIPEKGQIQIIIKNQNKTAVKLFLVPYDLTGMEPGTKTFVRQRSYSAGPIMDNIPATSGLDSMDRPILRYLVHLHICCPSKGRYYLYKSIRIVFANRVPDGKEKLRNETTWPEPRYTPYKPIRVMHPPQSTSTGPAAMLAAEKAFRRRSSGFSFGAAGYGHHHHCIDNMHMHRGSVSASRSSGGLGAGNTLPLDPIPLYLPRPRVDSDLSDVTTADSNGIRSPGSSQNSRPSTKDSSGGASLNGTLYEKLNPGDLGYGGNAFSAVSPGSPSGAPESLLSQRLRSLGMRPPSHSMDD